MNKIIEEIIEIAKTGYLPDGDGVNESTRLWAEDIVNRIEDHSSERQVDAMVIPPTLKEIEAIIEELTFVTDEWGGSKIANWKWGFNLAVDGITEAAEAILKCYKPV